MKQLLYLRDMSTEGVNDYPRTDRFPKELTAVHRG